MALTKLELYNRALFVVGERPLASLTDTRPVRGWLDQIYDEGGIDFCLSLVMPKFALLTATLSTPVVDPSHSLDSVYTFPADYIGFYQVYADEDLNTALYRYLIEGRTIATDQATNIFLRYVSNTYALTDWTSSFAKVVEAHLARSIAPRINPNQLKYAEGLFKEYVETAVALEGIKETTPTPQTTTVVLDATLTSVYNAALGLLGAADIRDIADNSPARVALDNAYTAGAADYMLSLVRPKFASKVVALTVSAPSAEHGYDNVFDLPADFVTYLNAYLDENLDEPIHRYFIEAGTISTQVSALYLRYISSGVATTEWTTEYKRALSAYLAKEAAPSVLSRENWEARRSELSRIDKEFETRVTLATTVEGYKEPASRSQPAGTVLTAAWLKVYNRALGMLLLPHIVSVDDDSQARSALDNALNTGAVEKVLTDMNWDFAYRTQKLTYNPSYTPTWGFQYAFDIPSDFERIDQISGSEYFTSPLPYYREGNVIFTDVQEFYLRYTSSLYLYDPNQWPEYFDGVVAGEMAIRCGALKGADLMWARDEYTRLKSKAYAIDVQTNPPQKITQGSWTRARGSYRSRYRGRP